MITENISISTDSSREVRDITPEINNLIEKHSVKDGICNLLVTHTTCALTTGEVGEGTGDDFLEVAEKVIPRISFRHAHDPSHAWTHMASSLIGASLSLPIQKGKLSLGTWQSVLLVELDGPRERNIAVTLII